MSDYLSSIKISESSVVGVTTLSSLDEEFEAISKNQTSQQTGRNSGYLGEDEAELTCSEAMTANSIDAAIQIADDETEGNKVGFVIHI